MTGVKSNDTSKPKAKKTAGKIAFAEYHTEIYTDGDSEMDEDGTVSVTSQVEVLIREPITKKPRFLDVPMLAYVAIF